MLQHIKFSCFFLLILCSFSYADNNGEVLFKQCAGCHGPDGHNKAFGKSGIIAGQDAEVLVASLKYYRETEFKTHGTSLVMSKQVKNMNMQDLLDIVAYVSKLPK